MKSMKKLSRINMLTQPIGDKESAMQSGTVKGAAIAIGSAVASLIVDVVDKMTGGNTVSDDTRELIQYALYLLTAGGALQMIVGARRESGELKAALKRVADTSEKKD